jgi:hypothetical protein
VKAEWQPIETAPKDGTSVIAFGNYRWPDGIAPVPPNRLLEGIVSEVRFAHRHWQTGSCWLAEPTHWMPMPPPPTTPPPCGSEGKP